MKLNIAALILVEILLIIIIKKHIFVKLIQIYRESLNLGNCMKTKYFPFN